MGSYSSPSVRSSGNIIPPCPLPVQFFTAERSLITWPGMKHNTCYLVTLWFPIYFDRSLITGFIKGKNTILKRHKIYNKGPSLSLSVLRYVSKCPNTLYRFFEGKEHLAYTFWAAPLSSLSLFQASGLTFLWFDFFFNSLCHFSLVWFSRLSLNSIPHVSGSLWGIKEEVLYGRDRRLAKRGDQRSAAFRPRIIRGLRNHWGGSGVF